MNMIGGPGSAHQHSLAGAHLGGFGAHMLSSGLVSRRSGAGSRSWHPSPYVSDEEEEEDEDIYTREEKKSRIKAEIARRRRQIVENRSGIMKPFVTILILSNPLLVVHSPKTRRRFELSLLLYNLFVFFFN
jgi:hypothetical protein